MLGCKFFLHCPFTLPTNSPLIFFLFFFPLCSHKIASTGIAGTVRKTGLILSVLGSHLSTLPGFLVVRAVASTSRMFVWNLLPTVCALSQGLIAALRQRHAIPARWPCTMLGIQSLASII